MRAGDLAAIDQVEADGEVLKRRDLLLKAGREVQKLLPSPGDDALVRQVRHSGSSEVRRRSLQEGNIF